MFPPRFGEHFEQLIADPGVGLTSVFAPGRPVTVTWLAFDFVNAVAVINNQLRLVVSNPDYSITVPLIEVEPLLTVSCFAYQGGPSPNLASALNLSGVCGLAHAAWRTDSTFTINAVNLVGCTIRNVVYNLSY